MTMAMSPNSMAVALETRLYSLVPDPMMRRSRERYAASAPIQVSAMTPAMTQ